MAKEYLANITMLPTINIDLGKICAQAVDLSRGRQAFLGYTFAYHFNQVEEFAQDQSKSIDRVLTELVLAGMTAHPVKSAVLFWFSASDSLLFLTASDNRQRLTPMWMRELRGYMECGNDYVHPTARPFLLWDGNNLTRVYPPPVEKRASDQPYLCDLGNLFGYCVGPSGEGIVKLVRVGDPEFSVYSIVPEEAEEIVKVGPQKCVLSYAFYTLPSPPGILL